MKERKNPSKSGKEDVDTRYIVQTFDENLKEELAWQLKDVREEVERRSLEEEKESSDKMGEETKLPTGEQEEIPKHGEDVPLSEG